MRTRHLVAVSLLSALGTLGYGAPAPALLELAEAYAVSEAAVGALQGALAVPGIVLTTVLGAVSDRIGRGRVAVGCLIAFAVGGPLVGLSDSFGGAMAARLLQGVGFAGLLTIPPAVIGDRFTGRQRQRAVAVNTAILTTSSMLAPVLGGLVAATGDPRRIFLVYGAGILLIPSTIRVLGLARGTAGEAGEAAGVTGRTGTGRLLRELRDQGATGTMRSILLMTAGGVILLASTTGASLPLMLDQRFDMGPDQRGLMIALVNVGSALTSVWLASAAGRLGDRTVGVAGLTALAVGLLCVGVAPALPVLVVGTCLMGVGISGIYNAGQHRATRLQVTSRGMLIGAWSAATRLGQAVGPPAGTLVAGWVGAGAAIVAAGGAGVVLAVSAGVDGARRRRQATASAR